MKPPLIKSEMQICMKLAYHPGERCISEATTASIPSHICMVSQEPHLFENLVRVVHMFLCDFFMIRCSSFVNGNGLENMSNFCAWMSRYIQRSEIGLTFGRVTDNAFKVCKVFTECWQHPQYWSDVGPSSNFWNTQAGYCVEQTKRIDGNIIMNFRG